MTDFHIRTDCRLCAGPIEKVLDLGETALANELKSTREESLSQDRFPLFLSQCKACGHVQLPVVVKPERLFPPDYPYKSGTNPVFRAHLKEFAETVSGMMPPGAPVLEIASNDGTLQREFRALGHDAEGVDPAGRSESLDEACHLHVAFFSSEWARCFKKQQGAWLEKDPYRAIVALNVFAHVDDLNDFTAGVAALLPDDGLFVFEVGYLPDVIDKGLFDVIYAEHLSYHHLRPLVPFFRKHGLELVDAHRVDSQGGSIRCFVRRARMAEGGKPALHPPRMFELLRAEEGLSLEPLKRRIDNIRWETRELGRRWPDSNGAISGFGAPAKLTTLLSVTELAPRVIYDDNPAKVGRFTPGTGIPIRPSSELLADNPDYCIIFSWNFASEIMARFPGYKGKWVVPLPEFRVVPGAGSEAA